MITLTEPSVGYARPRFGQVGTEKASPLASPCFHFKNIGIMMHDTGWEIQPVHPKGDQSWIFIGRTDAEAETPILWPPDVKNWVIGKEPDAGKYWRQEQKGMTEDETVGWHEFEQAPGIGEGQGSLACCSLWGRKESDTTERLNWYWYWRDCNPSDPLSALSKWPTQTAPCV